MYDNIGGKIKGLAKVIFIIEAAICVIAGLVLASEDEAGILLLLLGPAVAWISSWLLYGFGELIEKTSVIAYNTSNANKTTPAPAPAPQVNADVERIRKLQSLRAQGLISEEEYQRAMYNKQ